MVLLGPLLLAVVSVIWAEEDYFPVHLNDTWDNARNYCQICYKDLTTMTPGNAHIIIQKVIALNLTSDYWIGLRENFSGPIAFSQWSNGAPVIYQNWYPGRPILKKPEVVVPTSPPPTTSTDGTTTSYDSTTTAGTTTHSTTAGTTSTSGTTHTSSTPIDEQTRCPTLAKLIACFNETYILTPITDDDFSTTKTSTLIITSSPTVSSTSPSTIHSTSSSTMLSTSSTTYTTTTALITSPSTSLMTSTSYSTPVPETDYDYIRDSCVALLSFGMWREKHCYESLPFICYDEQFTGTVKISNVTHSRSVVTWDKAPGDNVDHYRVVLHGSSINATAVNTTALNTTAFNTTAVNTTAFNTKVLTIEFQNLEAGKLHTVYVIPVKCARDLNSLNTKFYTLPMSISTLTKVAETTNSIALSWSKPEGGCDNYYVKYVVNGTEHNKTSPNLEYTITGLLPGLLHNITARCVVNDSIFGEPSEFILVYTKPSLVQNLTASNNESFSVYVTWSSNDSNSSSYSYNVILKENKTENTNYAPKINTTISESTTNLKNLTPGTQYTLSVSALVGNPSVEGEAVTISVFTMPEPVTNLSLQSTEKTIDATWDLKNGSFSHFRVQLYLNTEMVQEKNTTEKSCNFLGLMSTTQYKVSISTIIGNLSSCPVNETIYTRPIPPTNLNITVLNQTHVKLKWDPPANSNSSQNLTYNVKYIAPFWSISPETFNITSNSKVISDLKPGTKYYFNVSVYAGNLMSDPVCKNASTATNLRNLTLTMLCSSNVSLYCKQSTTKTWLQGELYTRINNEFQDNINWNLSWKDGKF